MAARSPGRPKDAEKRDAILSASTTLFAERGLEAVPIETIAAAAGVSKVTVYANFKCKSEILAAIVGRHNAQLLEPGAALPENGTLAERLTGLGYALVDMLGEPTHRALDRCLSLEVQRSPELARQFFEAGPGQLRRHVADMLQQAADAGEIKLENSLTAAEDLIGLWLGFAVIERKFCADPPDHTAMINRIDRGVALFLRANAA